MALCELYQQTRDTKWLQSANAAFAFWRDHFMAPTGQVADGIGPKSDALNWDVWTYNQVSRLHHHDMITLLTKNVNV